MLREEDNSYEDFIDYFRPGYVREIGKIGKFDTQKYYFCSSDKTENSNLKSIFEYSENRYGKVSFQKMEYTFTLCIAEKVNRLLQNSQKFSRRQWKH